MGFKKSDLAVYLVFLPVFIAFLCGPVTVYLYFSNNQMPLPSEAIFNNTIAGNGTQCREELYTGICLGPLQSCISPSTETGSVRISSDIDLNANEQLANRVIVLLTSAYPNCLASAHRFLCQYLFPLCDENGTLYEPTYQECVNISEGVCKEAWSLAPSLNIPLPVCLDLPNTTSICNANATAESFEPALSCSEHYYYNGSVCLAECGVWSQFPPSLAMSAKGTELSAALFGTISQIILIIMFIHERKRIAKFPSIFMVYHTVCYFIIMIFVAINHIVPYSLLFCSGRSVIDTITSSPTPFCTLSGIVLQYFFPSMCWWWIFHIFGVFWMFVFADHAKRHAKKFKLVHFVMVVCGVLLPLPGVIGTLATDGYSLGRFPPLLCTTKNPDVFYYSVVFLANVILTAGLFMLVVLYWTLYKHKRFVQLTMRSTAADENRKHTLLLGVLTYYIIFGTLIVTQQSIELGQSQNLKTAIIETFKCEALGRSANCTTSYEKYSYPRLSSIVYLLMGLIPAVHMVFVLPTRRLWNYCFRVRSEDKNMLLNAQNSMKLCTDM